MKKELENYQKQLNDKNNLPDKIYRRNHPDYPLICYINNILGTYVSLNFESLPLFISRAYYHIIDRKNHNGDKLYYELVMEYLIIITKFILTQNIKNINTFLPKELLSSLKA